MNPTPNKNTNGNKQCTYTIHATSWRMEIGHSSPLQLATKNSMPPIK